MTGYILLQRSVLIKGPPSGGISESILEGKGLHIHMDIRIRRIRQSRTFRWDTCP